MKKKTKEEGKEVVVLYKMDGENTTWYNDYNHARSLENVSHPSRSYNKNEWAQKGWQIPEGWRICGENLYAKHSIHYENLKSYFYVFNIWDDLNNCLSWDETLEYCELLNLTPVEEIYRGIWDEELIRNIKINPEEHEGYVVRLADSFHYSQFRKYVGKYVRKNHVHSHGHWSQQKITINKII